MPGEVRFEVWGEIWFEIFKYLMGKAGEIWRKTFPPAKKVSEIWSECFRANFGEILGNRKPRFIFCIFWKLRSAEVRCKASVAVPASLIPEGSSFCAYNWKLLAYIWASLLTVVFGSFLLAIGAFILTIWAFNVSLKFLATMEKFV